MSINSGMGHSGIVAIPIPPDGATGEQLTKQSPADYDMDWDPAGTGPTVDPGTIDDTILRWNTATPAWEEFTAYILPLADGTSGQVISTDGAGTLTFVDPAAGGATFGGVWQFDSNTTIADPGSGLFRMNTGSYATVTTLAIDDEDDNGVDLSNLLSILDSGDVVYIQRQDDGDEFVAFDVTGPAVDNTGWFSIPVDDIVSGDFLTDGVKCSIVLIIGGSAATLQSSYDQAPSVPQITINAVPNALTVRGSVAGDIFEVQRSSAAEMFRVTDLDVSLGIGARRWGEIQYLDLTGRFGCELWPDDFSITTATGISGGFVSLSTRTITLNIPGGGGVGNDIAPAGMNFTHQCDFVDQGFLFASQLLINAAQVINCQATVGPLYLFLDQYLTRGDGGARTCTQHNTIRAQPRWGPNVSGGSITQTSAELIFLAASVDATVGSASITTLNKIAIKGVTLTAGGTVGTYNAIDIVNITGPTTIRGINSAMDNGDFILHAGDAPVRFTSAVFEMDFVDNAAIVLGTGDDVEVSWDGSSLDVLFALNSDVLELTNPAADNIRFDMTGTGGININADEIAFGSGLTADGTNSWQAAFSPPATSVGASSDFARRLFSAGGVVSVTGAVGSLFTDIINEPFATIAGGSVTNAGNMLIQTGVSVGTNRYGLLITSNPSGGTLNYALRVLNGDARFDARVDIDNPIALGGGAVATLGTIGGTGPTAAAQAQWLEIDIGGVAHWIPVWT